MRRRLDKRTYPAALLILLSLVMTACVQLAGYDQQAYQNATSLKAETLAMVEKSAEDDSFSTNEAAIEGLLVRLSAAYEYANGIEHNNEAAKNWRDLIGDDRLMIKRWVADWRSAGRISKGLVPELREQFAEGFDTIICLEANKRKLTACPNLTQ